MLSRTLRGLLLTLVLASLAHAQAPNTLPEGLVKWQARNAVQSVSLFKTDWSVSNGGNHRFEGGGLRLLNNSSLTSRFQLADKSSCTLELTAQNQNFFLDLCGETIKVEAVPGAHKYWITVRRTGKHLWYNVVVEKTVVRKNPYGKGKMHVREHSEELKNTILMKDGEPGKLSRITFGSRRVQHPFLNENSFKDVVMQSIRVYGPVKPSPDDKPVQKKQGDPKIAGVRGK